MKTTIDITPTWRQALNIYLMTLDSGTHKGKKAATEGLQQMADVAQLYADLVKRVKEKGGTAKVYFVNGALQIG